LPGEEPNRLSPEWMQQAEAERNALDGAQPVSRKLKQAGSFWIGSNVGSIAAGTSRCFSILKRESAIACLLVFGTPAVEEGRGGRTLQQPSEADYYPIVDIAIPADIVLEVGGIVVLDDGRPLVCTRRGEVFVIENAYGRDAGPPTFKLWAQGLHEPLGLLAHNGWIYTAQRQELTRMRDEDGDDRADVFETVCDDWNISGNYHEYAFGPTLDREGNFWITLNKPFGDEPFGKVDFRGWAMRISPGGELVPTCCGLRSPAGIEQSPWGDVFYTDNQGEWCGANKLSWLRPGDFHGHPHGLDSCRHPSSPVPHPGDPRDGELMPDVAKKLPTFRLPSVWFPYEKMGKSASGLVWDTTGGKFGPFAGQLLVGDQHHACINRVFLEKVDGEWQGACFPFRYGFACGVLRLCFGTDDSLLVGMTNRGWGSRGKDGQGLQRTFWNGKVPFEVHEMRVQAAGFELTFTRPIDGNSAADVASYSMESYTYKLHSEYGSPEVDRKTVKIQGAEVASDHRGVRLFLESLREGYVHELWMKGMKSVDGESLVHPDAYYTVLRAPR